MIRKMFLAALLVSLAFFMSEIVSASDKEVPPQQVTVDAKSNASKDSRGGWQSGKKLTLPPGIYEVKAVDGGWSAWKQDSSAPPDVKGAWTYNVFIRTTEKGNTCYGACGEYWQFNSQKDAFNYASKNYQPVQIVLQKQDDVYFWIFDDGNVNDNRGSIVLEVKRK